MRLKKLMVLRFIAVRQQVCAEDLAEQFGLSVKAASMRLLSYHHRGWLRRMGVCDKGYRQTNWKGWIKGLRTLCSKPYTLRL